MLNKSLVKIEHMYKSTTRSYRDGDRVSTYPSKKMSLTELNVLGMEGDGTTDKIIRYIDILINTKPYNYTAILDADKFAPSREVMRKVFNYNPTRKLKTPAVLKPIAVLNIFEDKPYTNLDNGVAVVTDMDDLEELPPMLKCNYLILVTDVPFSKVILSLYSKAIQVYGYEDIRHLYITKDGDVHYPYLIEGTNIYDAVIVNPSYTLTDSGHTATRDLSNIKHADTVSGYIMKSMESLLPDVEFNLLVNTDGIRYPKSIRYQEIVDRPTTKYLIPVTQMVLDILGNTFPDSSILPNIIDALDRNVKAKNLVNLMEVANLLKERYPKSNKKARCFRYYIEDGVLGELQSIWFSKHYHFGYLVHGGGYEEDCKVIDPKQFSSGYMEFLEDEYFSDRAVISLIGLQMPTPRFD